MNKILVGSSFIILLALSAAVVGQTKDLTEKQFNEIKAAAEAKLVAKIYRLTKTEEQFPVRDGVAETIHVKLTEIVPPNKRRELEVWKSPRATESVERIWDGKFLFERRDNGEWVKYSGGGSAGADIVSGRITTAYRLIEKTTLNKVRVIVYEVEKNRFANKASRDSVLEAHYIDKTRYWIAEDGSYIKSVQEQEEVGAKWFDRNAWVYEYPTEIKIEAPIK